MPAPNHKKAILVLLLWLPGFLVCFADKPRTGASKGLQFNFGPAIGFYSINPRHARRPFQKMSALAGFKKEWRLDKEHQSFFLSGLDYFFHGLGFKSYFFKPDSLQLYDNSFAFDYSLYIHELHLPLQFKHLFKRRDNKLFSSYVQLGYHLRYLLTSDLKITEYGNKIKYDSPEMKFRTPLLSERVNTFISVSYGLQKNNIGSSKGNFFVELNFRYGISDYYLERSYMASSMYIKSGHLLLLLGFKL